MQERIHIINSFERISSLRWVNLSLEKRIAKARTIGLLFGLFVLFTAIIFFAIIFNDLYDFGWRITWDKASLVVILGVVFSLYFADNLYKYLLLNHLKKIQNQTITNEKDAVLNQELQKIVTNLDQFRKKPLYIALAAIIVVGSIVNLTMQDSFEYWRFFKIPTLIYFAFFFKEVYGNYINLKMNMDAFEKLWG